MARLGLILKVERPPGQGTARPLPYLVAVRMELGAADLHRERLLLCRLIVRQMKVPQLVT